MFRSKSTFLLLCFCIPILGCQSVEPSVRDVKVSNSFSLSSIKSDEIQIVESVPPKELLESASGVTINGKAGYEVHGIRAWKFCEGDHSGYVDVPVLEDGTWTFTYNNAPMGICRGRNTVVFQPSSICSVETYSTICAAGKWFEFTSKTGYLYPDSVMITGEPLNESGQTLLFGVAGSNVYGITGDIWCQNAETTKTITLERPSGLRGEWQWGLPLRESDHTLCRGEVSVTLRSSTPCTGYCDFPNQSNAGLDLSFDHGYFPPEKDKVMQRVLALQKKIITNVSTDPSTVTSISSKLLIGCGDVGANNPPLPHIVVPPKKLDENFSVQLSGSGTEATIEFLHNSLTGSGTYTLPTPLSHDCNAATIYYLRPDRIIVDEGSGFESGPYISMWDGKKWIRLDKILDGQVPVQTVVNLGGVNKQYFVIQEEPYCCDETNPVVLGRWARYVIDLDTLKIVDVFFDDKR